MDFDLESSGNSLEASGAVTFPSCCDEEVCEGEKQRVAEFITPFSQVLEAAEDVCLRVDIQAGISPGSCEGEPVCSIYQGEGFAFGSKEPVRLFPCDSRVRKNDCPFCPEYDVFSKEYCEGITLKATGEAACVWTAEVPLEDTCAIGYDCEIIQDPCQPLFNDTIVLYEYRKKEEEGGQAAGENDGENEDEEEEEGEGRRLASANDCGPSNGFKAYVAGRTISRSYQFRFDYASNQCGEITAEKCKKSEPREYNCLCNGRSCSDKYPGLIASAITQQCTPGRKKIDDWSLEVKKSKQDFDYSCRRPKSRSRRVLTASDGNVQGKSRRNQRALSSRPFDEVDDDTEVPMDDLDCIQFPRPNQSRLEEAVGYELEMVEQFCETGEVEEIVNRPPYPEGKEPLFIRAVTPRIGVYQAILRSMGVKSNRCTEDVSSIRF